MIKGLLRLHTSLLHTLSINFKAPHTYSTEAACNKSAVLGITSLVVLYMQ